MLTNLKRAVLWGGAVVCCLLGASPELHPSQLQAGQPKAAEKASERDRVVKFLKDHVIGKTLATPATTWKLDGGKVEVVMEDQTTLSNLVETANGFQFDVTSVSDTRSFDLDAQGKRIMPGRNWSGVSVARVEINERKSTKKLVGLSRTISTTMKDDDGGGFAATQMSIQDGQLVVKDFGILYYDYLIADGKFKPGTFEGTTRYSVEKGKLQSRWEGVTFDVDPETLQRTPSKDKLPPMIAKEIERK
jgi:hypothetical protein